MHVHLPKPLHGWREFIGEVGVIVVGVFIALSAENVIERWHWREESRVANDAFKDEIKSAALVAYERLGVQPCFKVAFATSPFVYSKTSLSGLHHR